VTMILKVSQPPITSGGKKSILLTAFLLHEQDQLLMNMEYVEWTAAISPRVQGTRNLQNVLGETQLDFFALFSSLSGICGLSGQTKYAAANTFMGSFAKYR